MYQAVLEHKMRNALIHFSGTTIRQIAEIAKKEVALSNGEI